MVGAQPNDLRDRWWTLIVPAEIDPNLPGIYEWRIGDRGIYIGKSKRVPRRIREYPNNVRKLITGLPYRKGKPTSYREVHHELRLAHDQYLAVTVTVLENCEIEQLNAREQCWIAVRRGEAERGGPRVLNATQRER